MGQDKIVDAAREYIGRGYRHDFRVEGAKLFDVTAGREIDPADVQVDASVRFELAPDGSDASNLYAITDHKHGVKGLVIDAFDLVEVGAPAVSQRLGLGQDRYPAGDPDVPTHFGVRKVSKGEFNEDPERYVLRVGFPDFPPCPFSEAFSMLGFDTAEQTYVWLATKILRDDRLKRIPYNPADVPDNA